jgi:hypothetical protein
MIPVKRAVAEWWFSGQFEKAMNFSVSSATEEENSSTILMSPYLVLSGW